MYSAYGGFASTAVEMATFLGSQDQTPSEKIYILCAALEERTAIGVCNGGECQQEQSFKEN